jgi:hypothetical protein
LPLKKELVVISHFHIFPGSGADHGQDLDELRDLLGQNRGRPEGIYLLRRRVSAMRRHSDQLYLTSGQPKISFTWPAQNMFCLASQNQIIPTWPAQISSTLPAQNKLYLASQNQTSSTWHPKTTSTWLG